ncbi:hypothetical protein GCM10023323_36040 [Streptomyces thinghirensis]|uniref:Uncharacterized protein n=1 Tax=Streptomyces thinghirensis TaxID=551547 RepID=A0ABP9T6I8_9ACTN
MPAGTARSTPSTARVSPNVFTSPAVSIASPDVCVLIGGGPSAFLGYAFLGYAWEDLYRRANSSVVHSDFPADGPKVGGRRDRETESPPTGGPGGGARAGLEE